MMGSPFLFVARRVSAFALASSIILVYGSSAYAAIETLANWTFETSVPTTSGPHAAELGLNAGSGSPANGFHASASVVYSNPVGNGSTESFSSTFWAIGDYYQFQTNTVGFENITISWDQTRSSTGPANFLVQYSTDGSVFTNIPALLVPAYTVPVVTWSSTTPEAAATSSFSRDLSTISALNNDGSIFLRLTAASAPGGTAGTNRVDNFVIKGAAISTNGAVPEASAFLVWSVLCGSVLTGVKRCRSLV